MLQEITDKIEVILFFKPFNLEITHKEKASTLFVIKEAKIVHEFHPKKMYDSKRKIFILTPNQFIEMQLIPNYDNYIQNGSFIIIDHPEHPATIKTRKKIQFLKQKTRILCDIRFPYTKKQFTEEIKNAIYHEYLHANKTFFENFNISREAESKSLNDISKAMLTDNTSSIESLFNAILKASVEISNADAGFLILNEENNFRKTQLDHGEKQLQRIRAQYNQKSRIMNSQNIHLRHEFLDPARSHIINLLINQGTGISWWEEEEQVFLRNKNQFLPRFIPEFSFDQRTYKIKSYCAFPIFKPGYDVQGFIILFNKKSVKNKIIDSISDIEKYVTKFTPHDLNLLESLANHAGVSLTNAQLIHDLRKAFESFTAASVTAIESRDPSTKGHSERVALLTVGLAEAINKTENGPLSQTQFSKLQIEEIRYASLLHDFGKIGVREHILTKEKKLFNHQLTEISNRFDSIKDKLHIYILESYIEKLIAKNEKPRPDQLEKYKKEIHNISQELDNFWQIILEINEPSVENNDIFEKIAEIASMRIMVGEQALPLLTSQEIDTLSIKRGSLNMQERLEIESHVTHSYNFLVQIPWTAEFKNIPDIVWGHHERVDGSGYPRRLLAKEIPIQAKMMAISDIFDALVAQDRPYKKSISFERALNILEHEVKAHKLDADLFKVFCDAKIFEIIRTYISSQAA